MVALRTLDVFFIVVFKNEINVSLRIKLLGLIVEYCAT